MEYYSILKRKEKEYGSQKKKKGILITLLYLKLFLKFWSGSEDSEPNVTYSCTNNCLLQFPML